MIAAAPAIAAVAPQIAGTVNSAQNFTFKLIGYGLLVIAAIVSIYFLRKFIIAKGEEVKIKAVEDSTSVGGKALEDKSIMSAAFKKAGKRIGDKWTTEDIKKLCPNYSKMSGYVTKLWDAKGFLNDKESYVFGVFRGLYSQFEISYLANLFEMTHTGRDLYSFLDTFLEPEEMAKIYDIIKIKKLA